jgi:hypothetical protein
MADSTTAAAASSIVFHHGIGRHDGLSGNGGASSICPTLKMRSAAPEESDYVR